MRDAQPRTIYLKDYRPPAFVISRTELDFQLHEDETLVTSRLHLLRDPHTPESAPLELHGQELQLIDVSVDGKLLGPDQFEQTTQGLTIHAVPDQCVVSCRTRIFPQNNSSLEGLYKSRSMFCTQCEAEGFRKITYYLDRPDVMSVFTVSVEAEQQRYPVLLSNGNLVEAASAEAGRHRVVWHDPHPKPAYLFALVAGDLDHVEDRFTTTSGRDVTLRIYVEPKDIDKCGHAMMALQQSMAWDEQVYGREYDLDIFNIVAVDDFNMGAMENKSLNIFNTSCVLCSPHITTDAGFQRVQAIVAHEYFHNWSGNRVTCRDWFQLSLKEGFTVFRDAQFSADMGSPTVKRVEDVSVLRSAQFAEDAGPMAHPVRPDSFMEINNFYTLTVYEKGAEVVRMIHTLLGPEAFRRGTDLYFERHDGQAVTCEEFVRAMEEAGAIDLTQFRNWYSQSGTPVLTVTDTYDVESKRYSLKVSQSCPPTPGQPTKEPFVIPLAMGLLGDAGNLPLQLADQAPDTDSADNTHTVLQVDGPEHRFEFENVPERPIPSLLRGFSAPVRLHYDYSRRDLRALMSRDADGFVRWDSAQQLAIQVLNEVEVQVLSGVQLNCDSLLIDAFADLLDDESLDPAMVADMLNLPSESYLAELASHAGEADVDAIHQSREYVQRTIGLSLTERFLKRYEELASSAAYAPNAQQIAARSLRNMSLRYLVSASDDYLVLAHTQFDKATNLTDRLAALRDICFAGDDTQREGALARFYERWQDEALVVNQWLQLQAVIPDEQALDRVQALTQHQAFDIRNPNKVRALIGAFAAQNAVNFHRRDGAGYRLLGTTIEQLNALNPQIASRLLTPLTKWRCYRDRQALMQAELQRLARLPDLSPDVYEVVNKSLNAELYTD